MAREFHPCPFKKGEEEPFHSSIIGNFMVYKIDLKQMYCSYLPNQKIDNGFR